LFLPILKEPQLRLSNVVERFTLLINRRKPTFNYPQIGRSGL
jgi:hypothetical protein